MATTKPTPPHGPLGSVRAHPVTGVAMKKPQVIEKHHARPEVLPPSGEKKPQYHPSRRDRKPH